MASLQDITSRVWGIAVNGYGYVAEGIADLRQCIELIIRTTKGTDPLRPEFGSDVYKFIDKPVSIAIPNIKKAIIESVGIWEPRIEIVLPIKHRLELSHIYFDITYRIKDSGLLDNLLIGTGSNGIITGNTPFILQADIPYNPNIYRYFIEMVINSNAAVPDSPAGGFDTPQQMYDWARANWGIYGTWYLTADKIIVYLVPGNYHDSWLAVTLLNIVKLFTWVPQLDAEQQYELTFDPGNGKLEADHAFSTAAAMLLWAQENWNAYGTWALEYVTGDFGDDFSGDFSKYNQILALYTSSNPNGVITVNAAASTITNPLRTGVVGNVGLFYWRFTLIGDPVPGQTVQVSFSYDTVDDATLANNTVTCTVSAGMTLIDIVNDLYNQMVAMANDTVISFYTDPLTGISTGLRVRGFSSADGSVLIN